MKKQVLCLAGATGSGKTALALALAREVNGEIVNLDSRQVYRDFPIITAAPNAEEQAQCPHHLYSFLPTSDKLSAGRYAERVVQEVDALCARGKVPILVGGTGLYFKVLLEGIASIPVISPDISHQLLERCAACGSACLHEELQGLDPDYAAKIHPNDKQRIVRALEVHAGTGKTFTWWHANAPRVPLVHGLYMGLHMELSALRPRLDARIDVMLEAGALKEAQAALEHCDDGRAPGWSGIGCAELYAHIRQGLSLDAALELWRKNTRAYAKRQLTWFRAVPEIQWFTPQDAEGVCQCAVGWLTHKTRQEEGM